MGTFSDKNTKPPTSGIRLLVEGFAENTAKQRRETAGDRWTLQWPAV